MTSSSFTDVQNSSYSTVPPFFFPLFHSFLSKNVAMETALGFHSLSSSHFGSKARERETLISEAMRQPLGIEEGHGGSMYSQDIRSQLLFQ